VEPETWNVPGGPVDGVGEAAVDRHVLGIHPSAPGIKMHRYGSVHAVAEVVPHDDLDCGPAVVHREAFLRELDLQVGRGAGPERHLRRPDPGAGRARDRDGPGETTR
jgi:hypothetical protein